MKAAHCLAGQTDSRLPGSQDARRSEKGAGRGEQAKGHEGKKEGRAAKVAALGERQVERRREQSLVHALSLLRNIKGVIQGLPEDHVLTPSSGGALVTSSSGSGVHPFHLYSHRNHMYSSTWGVRFSSGSVPFLGTFIDQKSCRH